MGRESQSKKKVKEVKEGHKLIQKRQEKTRR